MESDECVDHAFGSLAVSVGLAPFGGGSMTQSTLADLGGVVDQLVPVVFEGLDPLRLGAQRASRRAEEERLRDKAKDLEMKVEPRLLTSFKRIRKNARNGLGIVYVQRDACGGCFNKIPPQRQLDIKMHKKIIVCEYCGRIMIDPELAGVKTVAEEEKPKRKRAIRKRTVVKKEMIGVPEDRLS